MRSGVLVEQVSGPSRNLRGLVHGQHRDRQGPAVGTPITVLNRVGDGLGTEEVRRRFVRDPPSIGINLDRAAAGRGVLSRDGARDTDRAGLNL